ncbi:MAG: hypothetical protein AB1349_10700 [Elusimicrobiota bacterium]
MNSPCNICEKVSGDICNCRQCDIFINAYNSYHKLKGKDKMKNTELSQNQKKNLCIGEGAK